MTQEQQPPQRVGIHSDRDTNITNSRVIIILGDVFIILRQLRDLFLRIPSLLWRHKSALLGVALMCGTALYLFSHPIISLIAENMVFPSFFTVGLLIIMALLAIGCFVSVPLFFGAVFGPRMGFFVGIAGLLLSGLLTYWFAALSYPTKAQTVLDLWSAVLLVLVGVLFLAIWLVIRHTVRRSTWIRTHYWKSALGGVVVVIVLLAGVYKFSDMKASTHLQGQDFPLAIPLVGCETCDPVYLQLWLEGITLDQQTSTWHLSLTNSAGCEEIAFLPQSIMIRDTFSTVYQPIAFSGLALRLDQGAFQGVDLRYQIVPQSTHHLWLDLSLRLTSCSGGGNAAEEVHGSQLLLFQ